MLVLSAKRTLANLTLSLVKSRRSDQGDAMSVVSQPFQAAIPTPAKPTANGIDSVLRRSSRSQLAQPTALTNNSLLPPQSQSSVVSRAAKRKANAAIASSRASIGLDVAANVSGPALDEPSDDHEPLSKRQKQATEQKAPTKGDLTPRHTHPASTFS